jgi:hypothetical protein
MEKKYDGFSMQEAMHLAQSDAGQQLLQLLRSNHGDAARSALEKAQNGDIAQARQALQAFLADPQAQELLRRLKEGHNG